MTVKNGNKPASRADLHAVESGLRSELQRLDQKIDGVHRSLAVEAVKTRADMGQMREELVSLIRAESERAAARHDFFAARLQTKDRESLTIPHTLDAHGQKLRDHETRIQALESPERGQ